MRVVVVDRMGPVDPAADELFAHAVAALALLHTVTDRLFQARWLTVRTRWLPTSPAHPRSPPHAAWRAARSRLGYAAGPKTRSRTG